MKKMIKFLLNRNWNEVKVFEQKFIYPDKTVHVKQAAIGLVHKKTNKRKVAFVGDKDAINPYVLQDIYDWVNIEPKSNVTKLRVVK